MRYCALVVFLIGCCAVLVSQELVFSRRFDAARKNQPLALLNHHPGYFHVLRYNREAHDLIVEKRAKPSAELLAFTPLRLDEINAGWFDYRNLEYVFFENNGALYFVFEKVVNNRKTIYMKVIDSLARSSGFIEVAALETDRSAQAFHIEFSVTPQCLLLLVSTLEYQHHFQRKVYLYNPATRSTVWSRRLPPEDATSGFSSAYTCGPQNDLYYARVRSKVTGFRRHYLNHQQVSVPVLYYQDVSLVRAPASTSSPLSEQPLLANLDQFSGLQILPDSAGIQVQAWYALTTADSLGSKVYRYASSLSADLRTVYHLQTLPLDSAIERRLTFFDGGDYAAPAYKDYRLAPPLQAGSDVWTLVERRDQNYYKELVVWGSRANRTTVGPLIMPRKLFGFESRTRFRYAGEVMMFLRMGSPCFVVAEAPGNLQKQAHDFNYHRFRNESNLWRANLVVYRINGQGRFEKKLLFQNGAYDLIPVRYSQWPHIADAVFYLTSGRYEKFAIWPAE